MNPVSAIGDDREYYLRLVYEHAFEFLGLLSPEGIVLAANPAALRHVKAPRESIIGSFFWKTPWWQHSSAECRRIKAATQQAAQGEFVRFETTHPAEDGSLDHVDFSLTPIRDDSGKVVFLLPEGRRINALMPLKKAHDELERRFSSRTQELDEANQALRRMVNEKTRTAQALKQREAELELKTAKLEDMNTALRYLLKKLDREKTAVEEKMMADLRDLVHPYLKKLAKKSHDREVTALVTILENHLKAIVAPFSRYLTSPAINLSPAELNVAKMVKDGHSTRQIADILNVAYKTVETHRVNIRKKLGLTGKGTNLRTCLMAMQKPMRGLETLTAQGKRGLVSE